MAVLLSKRCDFIPRQGMSVTAEQRRKKKTEKYFSHWNYTNATINQALCKVLSAWSRYYCHYNIYNRGARKVPGTYFAVFV